MAFGVLEASKRLSNPIELYYFSRGNDNWAFTSADFDFDSETNLSEFDLEVYLSRNIKRSSIAQGIETVKNAMKLEVAPNFEIVDEFRGVLDGGVISLSIIRVHPVDPIDGDNDYSVIWTGRVLGCKIEPDRAELNCEPVTISLKRNGLRKLYSKVCTHVLYGLECQVNKVDFRIEVTVTSIEGNIVGITPSISPNNILNGGFVETPDLSQRAMLGQQDQGNQLILVQPIPGLQIGDDLDVYRGCDHTTTACRDFNNIDNFGGYPWIPIKNPFNTGIF